MAICVVASLDGERRDREVLPFFTRERRLGDGTYGRKRPGLASEFEQSLVRLGFQQYAPLLLQSGYCDWHCICQMSDAEFATMGIKLGHRRKLQREAARSHSWPDYKALPVGKDICYLHKKGVIVASEVDWLDQ